jgi:hypothetical protein
MSDSTSRLPARPSLEQLSRQAKELLKQHRAGEPGAADRFRAAKAQSVSLSDAQFVIARELGFETWAALKHHIEEIRPPGIEQFEQLARMLADAYFSGDVESIRAINRQHGLSFVWERQALDMQRRLPGWFASQSRTPELALADAQEMVAHAYGFENWDAFRGSFQQLPEDPRSAPIFLSTRPPFYKIDWEENRLTVLDPQTDQNWDAVFAVIKDHGIVKLTAAGVSDGVMQRLSRIDHVIDLDVGGSKALTDEGALHLARMPQLRSLSLGGWSTEITDRALTILRHLPELRRFGMG